MSCPRKRAPPLPVVSTNVPAYFRSMNLIRRNISLDPTNDARLRELAAERGQDEAAVLAEALALLDSALASAIWISPRTAAVWKTSSARARPSRCASGRPGWRAGGTDKELPRPKPPAL